MAKLKLEQFRGQLQPYVDALNNATNRARYISGDFPRADKVKDLDMRFRFDILWAIPSNVRVLLLDDIRLAGGTDTHINSLLASMIPTLK